MKKPVPFIPLRSAIIYPAPTAAALFHLSCLAFSMHIKRTQLLPSPFLHEKMWIYM